MVVCGDTCLCICKEFTIFLANFMFPLDGESHENINSETKSHFHLSNLCLVLGT